MEEEESRTKTEPVAILAIDSEEKDGTEFLNLTDQYDHKNQSS